MCSGMGDRTCLLPGFPIRTSPDQSSVDSSPGLFAASHVLLRLLVPRHPPCALTNLTTKMLASTVQFSSYGRAQVHTEAPRAHQQVCRSARTWSVARRTRQFPPQRVCAGAWRPKKHPLLQDPTACLGQLDLTVLVPASEEAVLETP